MYDDIGQRSSLYLELKAKPSIMSGIKHNKETFEAIGGLSKDGYYTLSNKFLSNPTKYTQGGIDMIESYLPGVPNVATRAGVIGGGIGNLYGWEQLYNDLKNFNDK